MSRYGILTDDENLEVLIGFDEGLEGFFLTISDARLGEPGGYLFHNMEHHESVRMTLGDVTDVMERFGMVLPDDLLQRLMADAARLRCYGGCFGIRGHPGSRHNTSKRSG